MGSCFERTPYASLIACVLTVTGVGVMCGTNFEAFRRMNFFFNEVFYPINSPWVFQLTGIVYSAVTFLLCVLNLSLGALSTGETRQKFYAQKRTQSSGIIYARLLNTLTHLVTGAWVLLFVLFAIPVSLWVMLHSVCVQETEYWRSISADKDETQFTFTFNLTNYGLYHRPLDTSLYSESINSPTVFTQFCEEISTIGPLFAICLFSSFLVIVGLVSFIASLSSTVVRLKLSAEIDRARQFPDSQDETALSLMANYSERPNTFSYANTAPHSMYLSRPGLFNGASFSTDTSRHPTPTFASTLRS